MSDKLVICTRCGGQVLPVLSVHNGVALLSTTASNLMKICTCPIAVVGESTGEMQKSPESQENYSGEQWRLVPEDTYPAVVKFVLKSPDMDFEAATKWDGCTDLLFTEKSANGDEEMCYHHICDLDVFIARLQEMRTKARAYFDGEFCVAPLTDEQHQQKMATIQQEVQET